MNQYLKKSFQALTLAVAFLILIPVSAQARYTFIYDMEVMSKEEIGQFSDEKLKETYIDVIVELEASKTFYESAGFTPKDYKQHKEFLRYRILLKQELEKRGLEVSGVRD